MYLHKYGLRITYFTADSYQSDKLLTDVSRAMKNKAHRFIYGKHKQDTDPVFYDTLKEAMYEGRVILPRHAILQKEILELERIVKGNITIADHPPTGSKDVADAVSCSIYTLNQSPPAWKEHGYSAYKDNYA